MSVIKGLKTGFRRRRRRRKLIGELELLKMGVASWHVRTLSHHVPSTFWVGLSLFMLEFGGRVAYMETHPMNVAIDIRSRVDQFHFCLYTSSCPPHYIFEGGNDDHSVASIIIY